jgi:hypothetical protein
VSARSRAVAHCCTVVRAANPASINDARVRAEAEFAKLGHHPAGQEIDIVANFAVARVPAAAWLKMVTRSYAEAWNILKVSSVPRWTYPPKSARRISSDAEGELFIYPIVDLPSTHPIFIRILAELPERSDRFDTVGEITNRAFPAWLSLEGDRVVVNIASTAVGHLGTDDVRTLRSSPDKIVPTKGEQVSVDGLLIAQESDQRLALWLPFPRRSA